MSNLVIITCTGTFVTLAIFQLNKPLTGTFVFHKQLQEGYFLNVQPYCVDV